MEYTTYINIRNILMFATISVFVWFCVAYVFLGLFVTSVEGADNKFDGNIVTSIILMYLWAQSYHFFALALILVPALSITTSIYLFFITTFGSYKTTFMDYVYIALSLCYLLVPGWLYSNAISVFTS